MNKATFVCCIMICSLFSLSACTKNNDSFSEYGPGDTLELKSNTNSDLTALLYSRDSGISIPDFPAFAAFGDGFGGVNGKKRSVMKFRIRHIDYDTRYKLPPIKKAVLYLYQYNSPADQNPYAVQQDAGNGLELHRIVGDWEDSTVTWNTQPALAEGSDNPLEDVVMIPSVTTPLAADTKDDQVIDVTDMMRRIFADSENKGFLLKLSNEDANSGRSYGSVACPNISKRPKLIIYF